MVILRHPPWLSLSAPAPENQLMTDNQGFEWSCAQWQGKEIVVTFAADGATATGKMIGGNEAAGWIALAVNPDSTRLVIYLHAVRSIQLASREEEEEWQTRFMQRDA
jgi:hypothetical protein